MEGLDVGPHRDVAPEDPDDARAVLERATTGADRLIADQQHRRPRVR
jgi:hypothetical protein